MAAVRQRAVKRLYHWVHQLGTSTHIAERAGPNVSAHRAGGGSFSVAQSGGTLSVVFTPVPEPSSGLLLAGVGLLVGRRVTRRGRPAGAA